MTQTDIKEIEVNSKLQITLGQAVGPAPPHSRQSDNFISARGE